MDWKDEGRAVREWRTSRGWKQEEAARRLGIDRTHLSSIETGRARAGQDLAGAIESLGGPKATVWCRYDAPVAEEQKAVPA